MMGGAAQAGAQLGGAGGWQRFKAGRREEKRRGDEHPPLSLPAGAAPTWQREFRDGWMSLQGAGDPQQPGGETLPPAAGGPAAAGGPRAALVL